MKMRKLFRISLLLCWMTFMLWMTVIPVKAEQIEKTMENQTVETKQQEEVIQVEDITGLNDEFAALEEESVLIIEEVEQYRREAKRKGIQKAIVIILVIAVFGAGILTAIREKRKSDLVLTAKEENGAEEATGGKD